MKARNETHDLLNVHAELYHRTKIQALRAEGERLREELRLRGIDPGSVLVEAGLKQMHQPGLRAAN